MPTISGERISVKDLLYNANTGQLSTPCHGEGWPFVYSQVSRAGIPHLLPFELYHNYNLSWESGGRKEHGRPSDRNSPLGIVGNMGGYHAK